MTYGLTLFNAGGDQVLSSDELSTRILLTTALIGSSGAVNHAAIAPGKVFLYFNQPVRLPIMPGYTDPFYGVILDIRTTVSNGSVAWSVYRNDYGSEQPVSLVNGNLYMSIFLRG